MSCDGGTDRAATGGSVRDGPSSTSANSDAPCIDLVRRANLGHEALLVTLIGMGIAPLYIGLTDYVFQDPAIRLTRWLSFPS